MVSRMKTTMDISSALYEEARRVAREERTTLKALFEEGLRRALADHTHHAPFKLREASFKGKGLQPEFADGSWEQIRNAAYKGRGG
jgi:hypothetical protein